MPTCLLINWPIKLDYQKSWTAEHIKNFGFVDIIGPDWRYLRSDARKGEDYEEYRDEMEQIEFMKGGKVITDEFHKVGLLVHPYVHKDDFMKYSETSPIDELEYYFEDLKLDGIFTENPKTAVLARDYFKHHRQEDQQYIYNQDINEFI